MKPSDALWQAILAEVVPTRSPRTRAAAGGSGPRALASGTFALDYPRGVLRRDYEEPQIVASVAGPCAESLAAAGDRGWGQVGADAAARAINRVVAVWAEPLFLTARVAVPEGQGERALAAVRGIAASARAAQATLLALDGEEVAGRFSAGGGEVACCAIGIAEERKAFAKRGIEAGDAIIALAAPLAKPTPVYARAILKLLRVYRVKHPVCRMAAIADDGILGAIAAILPDHLGASLTAGPWAKGPDGNPLARRDILREGVRSGLGAGFVLIAAKHFARSIAARLTRYGVPAQIIGDLDAGHREVRVRRG
ncbi:MAG: hypothetical protein JXP34_13325 [Planctomycetes bacterium]|nr:hypothetical protein [Planctomycetota bacterium]